MQICQLDLNQILNFFFVFYPFSICLSLRLCVCVVSSTSKLRMDKFSISNIEKALSPWAYAKDMNPKKKSIKSKTMFSQKDFELKSSFCVYKKYNLLPKVKFPSHYYVTIDGYIYHPGYPSSNELYNDTITDESQEIVMVKEMCHKCVYDTLKKLFNADKQFNILTNNCQIILGTFVEFFMLVLFVISLVFLTIFNKIVYLIICLLILILHITVSMFSKSYTFAHCAHILYDDEATKTIIIAAETTQ